MKSPIFANCSCALLGNRSWRRAAPLLHRNGLLTVIAIATGALIGYLDRRLLRFRANAIRQEHKS